MDKEFEQRVQQISINALIDIALGCERLQLFTAKLDAFRVINGRCNKYRELGYDSQIVLTVLEKKLELLKKAATVKKTAKISEPSAPTYHYNGMFETDDTWVAEEELIQWSLANLRAPLPPHAAKRYIDLFQRTFHINLFDS